MILGELAYLQAHLPSVHLPGCLPTTWIIIIWCSKDSDVFMHDQHVYQSHAIGMSMNTAGYYDPDWGCLADFFCNPGLKNSWYGQGFEPKNLVLSLVPMTSQPWRPLLMVGRQTGNLMYRLARTGGFTNRHGPNTSWNSVNSWHHFQRFNPLTCLFKYKDRHGEVMKLFGSDYFLMLRVTIISI